MIKTHRLKINGIPYIRTYSDSNKAIVDADGQIYAEAFDPETAGKVYEELEADPPVGMRELYKIIVTGEYENA